MKRKLLILFLFAVTSVLLAQKDPCNCNETTPIDRQHRTKAKHVTNYGAYARAKYNITPDDVTGWQDLYSTFTRNANKDTERILETPEDSLFVLDGYMYFVKQEANDCDYHIEIGPKSIKSKRRIIVEVSQENCDLQQKIMEYIVSNGFKLNKQFTKGLPCTVIGLGFYDAAHKPNHHGGNYTHKTSWELHPVKSIEFN